MNPTEPANPNNGQPTYVDPITGSPLYIDPATGQLSYGAAPTPGAPGMPPGVPGTPAGPAGSATPPTTPYAANPYTAAPSTAGYPATGYPTGYAYPGTTAAPGYSYPLSGYGYGQAQPKTNGLAIGALVTGIAGLPFALCYGVGGIVIGLVGAILGHVARRQIRDRGEAGGGMALAGIICGWLAVLLGIVVLVFVIYVGTHLDDFQTGQPDPFNT